MRVRVAALLAYCLCACNREANPSGTDLISDDSFLARVGTYELRSWPADVPAHLREEFLSGWQDAARATLNLAEARPSAVRAVERGLLVRSFFEDAAKRALDQRPLAETEQAEVVSQNWQLLDQPPAVEAAEVYLRVSFVESNEVALAKMEHIRSQTEGALSLDDFVSKVQSAASAVSAQIDGRQLPPLSVDGRVVPKSPSDDATLQVGASVVQALSQLKSPGELSPIVGTQGGYHLFYAVQLYPAEHLEGRARREALHSLLGAERSSAEVAELRKKLKSSVVIEKAGNVTSLLERIGRND